MTLDIDICLLVWDRDIYCSLIQRQGFLGQQAASASPVSTSHRTTGVYTGLTGIYYYVRLSLGPRNSNTTSHLQDKCFAQNHHSRSHMQSSLCRHSFWMRSPCLLTYLGMAWENDTGMWQRVLIPSGVGGVRGQFLDFRKVVKPQNLCFFKHGCARLFFVIQSECPGADKLTNV